MRVAGVEFPVSIRSDIKELLRLLYGGDWRRKRGACL